MSASRIGRRPVAVVLLFIFVLQLTITPVMALTSGPSQPEVQGFQPAGTTDMVDLFTGDFSYNIPLFELPGPNGGYPFNMAYQSGITMDQEASWVGLGWSLNPGAVNRQMRGLPDDFSGDSILTKTYIDPSVTVGLAMGGGVGLEFLGKDLKLGLSQSLSISMNNYKGMSYNVDNSIGFDASASKLGISGGQKISLNSDDGVTISQSLGLGGRMGEVGLGTSYNSKSGLSGLNMSYSASKIETITQAKLSNPMLTEKVTKSVGTFNATSSISFGHPGYSPQVTLPVTNLAFAATLKVGGAFNGVYPNGFVRGFYNEQRLKDNNKTVKSKAYGYFHYQKSTGDRDLLDVNREKDGMISQDSPNLAIPSLTYDVYSVTGQGMGAVYRPIRNDLGTVYDQEVSSESVDAGGGVDIGVPLHVGGNLSVNHSKSTSGKWKEKNAFSSVQTFQEGKINNAYEPWYFKVHGELTSSRKGTYDSLGGDNPVRVRLTGSGSDVSASTGLENNFWSRPAVPSNAINKERKSRNQVIQPITNAQLLSASIEMVSLFKVKYFAPDSSLLPYNRTGLPKNHIAGLTALTAEGVRYTYAIPAYNTLQEEVTFAVSRQGTPVNKVNAGNVDGEPKHDAVGTDKFLRTSKTPPYAHSYLLTSIVGPDYVDLTDDGVTEDDLGYWVKFTYHQRNSSANAYQWRDPFSQAHYAEGWKTDARDDKGSFTYGKKELWYLAKAETKSHIAVFHTTPREDGMGVAQRLQDTNTTGARVYRLQSIDLFTRAQNYKIKTVRFDYDYSLCGEVFNNSKNSSNENAKHGKLTLKKMWFEYGNTLKGKLNPYVFGYNASNPDYSPYEYDRWGTYKQGNAADPLQNIDSPYALQDPLNKKQIDDNAAAWSLTDIKLPSGGTIIVNYESDDYAYVQQQQAMQMVEMVDPSGSSNSIFQLSDNNLQVHFKLKKPIPEGSGVNQRNEVLNYLDQQRKQLYFKMKVNLREPGKNQFEYVSGYADINFNAPMSLISDGHGSFVYGSFGVVAEKNYHPFSIRAWQHIRANQPELAIPGVQLNATSGTTGKISLIKSITGLVDQVKELFTGYNKLCKKKGWGREVVASKSWIRLYAPDKIKFGGGLRVRQVTIKDQWQQDSQGTYGQLYEYTTTEKDGATISSGVAAYEPFIGGEENAVRYAKKFSQSVAVRSGNNLYFEYPINETYYPGPQVGYSKVTVTSLASAYMAKKQLSNIKLADTTKTIFPKGPGAGIGSTGMTVHEFYTAKDFPVITDETDKINKPYKLNVSIPFLGSVAISHLTASQGYIIITNDMHGKQKQVSNYRQDRTGKMDLKPISWVKYNYRTQTEIRGKTGIGNKVLNIFSDNGDGTLSIPTDQNTAPLYALGQETEFFTDMRQYVDKSWGGGANINMDGIFVLFGVIPIPSWWPSVTKTETMLRTSVVNKVVYKAGILESTEAYDGGSHVITRNLKWDKLTGAPVLTQVTNNFDAPVYNFSVFAHSQYPGMGAAYQNTGLRFSIQNVIKTNDRYQFTTSLSENQLFPGDEVLLYSNDQFVTPAARAIYMGENNGIRSLYALTSLSLSNYHAMVVRSGYRNQLSITAGSITALHDPSQKGTPVNYTQTVIVPAGKH